MIQVYKHMSWEIVINLWTGDRYVFRIGWSGSMCLAPSSSLSISALGLRTSGLVRLGGRGGPSPLQINVASFAGLGVSWEDLGC